MSDNGNIFKIWGLRQRLLLSETSEIDLLHLKANSFCSSHQHKFKINKFIVLEGRVCIESEYGKVILTPKKEFEIRPPLKHRFFSLEDSLMLEIAYVEEGNISELDILRYRQGGKIIDGEEVTLDEMRKRGLLEL